MIRNDEKEDEKSRWRKITVCCFFFFFFKIYHQKFGHVPAWLLTFLQYKLLFCSDEVHRHFIPLIPSVF